MLYRVIKGVVARPLRIIFRPIVVGAEHVPERGAAILASNHLSFTDPVLLPIVVRRKIVFLGKSDYFTGSGFKGRFVRAFMLSIGTVPVDRRGGSVAEAALAAGLRALERGHLLGIYPEGTRSPDGRLYRGKTGVIRLALAAGVPIVPVAMIGTDAVRPAGKKLPRRGRVGVAYGPPLDLTDFADRAPTRAEMRTLTDALMSALCELSGQEYVDEYAAGVKSRPACHVKAPRRRRGKGGARRPDGGATDDPPDPAADTS